MEKIASGKLIPWIMSVLVLVLLTPLHSGAAPLSFELTYAKKAWEGPFTGRVYVMLSSGNPRGLLSGPDWFNPEPFLPWMLLVGNPGKNWYRTVPPWHFLWL